MGFHFPVYEIPMLIFGIVLWILCCQLARKQRESEGWPMRRSVSPSVYVIPIYEEQEDELDIFEAYFQPPLRDPPIYRLGNDSPPPPYWQETPPYLDPPPTYTPPTSYSEQL